MDVAKAIDMNMIFVCSSFVRSSCHVIVMRILRRREKEKKRKGCGHLVVVAKDVAVGLSGNHLVNCPL